MILAIADVLTAADVEEVRSGLATAPFVDGRATAGWSARLVKSNLQASPAPEVERLRAFVETWLRDHPVFALATRPKTILGPLFSRYQPGHAYGAHVDDALMGGIRSDVSFTAVKQKKKKEAAAVAARLKGDKADPSEVRVRIFNGGAEAGSASSTLTWLQTEEGVTKSENAGNAPAELDKTTLEYAPDQAAEARRLADIMGLSGSAMKEGKSVNNAQGLPTMTLTLGADFEGAGVPLTGPAKAPDVDKSTADKVQCAE